MSRIALLVAMLFAGLARAGDDGDDFSNNLFSDLAPLLALFGERVTTQFMSQAMGWADNIILAMAPLGVVTIVISAIRVGGPIWLKAIIGRAREPRALAEGELMSSTSNEVCELWNGSKVVRIAGEGSIAEFICLMPLSKAQRNGAEGETSQRGGAAATRDADASLKSTVVVDGNSEDSDHAFELIDLEQAVKKGYMEKVDDRSLHAVFLDTITSSLPSLWRGGLGLHDDMEKKAQSTEESSTRPKPKFVIVRNSKPDAPNLLLNIDRFAGKLELWIIALFGIFSQVGILVYGGFITYYPELMFKKGGKRVDNYAFPCTSTGTILLVCGLLICSHVVESSTVEVRYRPVRMDARMAYLQKPAMVNDQAFGSYSIFSRDSKSVITTSRPGMPNRVLENKAVVGTVVGLSGFVIQFVGLRAMHWSATVVQLGATLTMTVLRAYIRRNLAKSPTSRKLRPGYELDWLATRLALRFCPEDHEEPTRDDEQKKSVKPNIPSRPSRPSRPPPPPRPPRPSESPHRESIDPNAAPTELQDQTASNGAKPSAEHQKTVELKQTIGHLANTEAWQVGEHREDWLELVGGHGGSSSRKSHDTTHAETTQMRDEAQNWVIDAIDNSYSRPIRASSAHCAMRIRKGLADISPWTRPISAEARALARAIEGTLTYLDGLSGFRKRSGETLKHNTMFVPAEDPETSDNACSTNIGEEGQGSMEIDCITWTLKSRKQGPISFTAYKQNRKWRAPEEEIEAALSLWLYAVDFQEDSGASQEESLGNPAASTQASTKSRALWVLGANSAKLRRDLCWWLPNEEVRVMAVGQVGDHRVSTVRDFDESHCDGLIGCAPKSSYSGWSSSLAYEAKELQRPYDTTSAYMCLNTSLAVESEHSQRTLFSQHMFGSFMWALANRLQRPIEGGAKLQNSHSASVDNRSTSYQHFTLHNEHLSRIARIIQRTDLFSFEEAYLCMIPPLSSANRLPDMSTVVETTHRHAVRSEQNGRQVDSGVAIDWLLATFPMGDPVESVVTSVAVAFLVSIAQVLKYWELQRGPQSVNLEAPRKVRGFMEAKEMRQLRTLKAELEAKISHRTGLSNLLAVYPTLASRSIRDASKGLNLPCIRAKALYPKFVQHAIRDDPTYLDTAARDVHFRTALHYAVIHQRVLIGDCLDAGANPDLQDVLGYTPLHYAVYFDVGRPTSELIRAGANVNVRSRDGSTPLHCAVMASAFSSAVALVNAGADPNALDGLRNTPLHLAALRGNVKLVQYLLPWTNRAICNDRTVLHQILLRKLAMPLRDIFGSRLTVEAATARDMYQRLPLHYAAWAGQEVTVMSELIELMNEVGPELEDSDRIRPSAYAAQGGHAQLSLELLRQEGDGTEHQSWGKVTILHFAMAGNSAELIENLVDEWPECIDDKDDDASSPLLPAGKTGSMLSTRALIDKVIFKGGAAFARFWQLERGRARAIRTAAENGHLEMVKLLLPGPTMENANQVWISFLRKNALHAAAKRGHVGVVKTLLEKGCPVDGQDFHGRTALHHAARSDNLEIAEILLSWPHDQDKLAMQDNHGNEPLAYAAWAGNLHLSKWLIYKGANIQHRNAKGETAFHLAAGGSTRLRRSRHRDEHRVHERVRVMEFLVQVGADPHAITFEGLHAKDLVKHDVYHFEDRRPMREPVLTYLEDLELGQS